jgi:hypothetical protein
MNATAPSSHRLVWSWLDLLFLLFGPFPGWDGGFGILRECPQLTHPAPFGYLGKVWL